MSSHFSKKNEKNGHKPILRLRTSLMQAAWVAAIRMARAVSTLAIRLQPSTRPRSSAASDFSNHDISKKAQKKFHAYNLYICCLFATFCSSYSCIYIPIFAVILFCISRYIILTNIELNSLYYLLSVFSFANSLSKIALEKSVLSCYCRNDEIDFHVNCRMINKLFDEGKAQ